MKARARGDDRAGAGRPETGRSVDLGFVFFGREELPFGDSALAPLLEREAGLRSADLAIVMEPTANAIHAGCLGNINATWTFHGAPGTPRARGWPTTRSTAPPRGSPRSPRAPPVEHEFDGLIFTEVVVGHSGSRAGSPPT